jgi:hypothetical protein
MTSFVTDSGIDGLYVPVAWSAFSTARTIFASTNGTVRPDRFVMCVMGSSGVFAIVMKNSRALAVVLLISIYMSMIYR